MKEYKTFNQQLTILRNRGLIVPTDGKPKRFLEQENYYNVINGYKDLFLLKDTHGKPVDGGYMEHVHLYNDKEKLGTYAQNMDGSIHDKNNNSKGDPPKKVREKLKQKTGWDWDSKKNSYYDKIDVLQNLRYSTKNAFENVYEYEDGEYRIPSSALILREEMPVMILVTPASGTVGMLVSLLSSLFNLGITSGGAVSVPL